jgi:hypothetical protein
MIVSLEAISLSALVMISQNRADEKGQVLADSEWRKVQAEERQNGQLPGLPNQGLALTRAIHAMAAARTVADPADPVPPTGTRPASILPVASRWAAGTSAPTRETAERRTPAATTMKSAAKAACRSVVPVELCWWPRGRGLSRRSPEARSRARQDRAL